MKVRNSLKSLGGRHRDNQLVRRKGRVYIINKVQKRYKARQGCGAPPRPRHRDADGHRAALTPGLPVLD